MMRDRSLKTESKSKKETDAWGMTKESCINFKNYIWLQMVQVIQTHTYLQFE